MNVINLPSGSRCKFNEVKECIFLVHLPFGEFGPYILQSGVSCLRR